MGRMEGRKAASGGQEAGIHRWEGGGHFTQTMFPIVNVNVARLILYSLESLISNIGGEYEVHIMETSRLAGDLSRLILESRGIRDKG